VTAAIATARRQRTRLPLSAIIAGAFLVILLATSIGLAFWGPDPNAYDLTKKFQPPSLEHLLGTDQFGRDVFLRVLSAAKLDLLLAALGTVIPAVIGTVLGAIAGYRGGALDSSVMRVADIIQAFPQYILLVALTLMLGAGWRAFIVGAAIAAWVTYARLVRGVVLQLKKHEFIESARAGGLSGTRVLFRHVIPNAVPQAVTFAASDFVLALAFLCSLGYLGLGVQPPNIEWGQMIAEGQSFLQIYWWIALGPGLAILAVGISMRAIATAAEGVLAK
jgi:peptide/nickel transport system permease protein